MTVSESVQLHWPSEAAMKLQQDAERCADGSNIVLDLHGDPMRAGLVVYADGNHHMALEASLSAFLTETPDAGDIFYITTPTGIGLDSFWNGRLRVGNLVLSIRPHVFIGPADILDQLVNGGVMACHVPFARSRGTVLLIRRGNPKNITGLADLLRGDVRLALPNPSTEAACHQTCRDTILGIAETDFHDRQRIRRRLDDGDFVSSTLIHHRDIPQILADDRADVAVIHFHLALRYARVFDDVFEIVPLCSLGNRDEATGRNSMTQIHIGLIGDGGEFGPALLEFMTGPTVAQIYDRHGLASPGR